LQVEISHLAQDALSIDRLSPQAWCVMGNCFSLQKEHETAIKFFQRALQIDPNFTYAYTLCGHEYYANEDFDKSLMLHRNAIAHDKRHYNAWCALVSTWSLVECCERAPMWATLEMF
jgi:anaphase-promoting complex subunit 3